MLLCHRQGDLASSKAGWRRTSGFLQQVFSPRRRGELDPTDGLVLTRTRDPQFLCQRRQGREKRIEKQRPAGHTDWTAGDPQGAPWPGRGHCGGEETVGKGHGDRKEQPLARAPFQRSKHLGVGKENLDKSHQRPAMIQGRGWGGRHSCQSTGKRFVEGQKKR